MFKDIVLDIEFIIIIIWTSTAGHKMKPDTELVSKKMPGFRVLGLVVENQADTQQLS